MAKIISRRRFLMVGAMGAAALLIPDLSACSPIKPSTSNPITPAPPLSASPTPPQPVSIKPTTCQLSRLIVPTRPATEPGYTQLDPATRLHMTGTPVDIDISTYRLEVTGLVNHELSLSYDDLRCMPKMTTKSTSICANFFEDHATWSGVPFAHILNLAGVKPEASHVTLKGADGYNGENLLTTALASESYLAYEWEGQPIPVLHGFPLRAIFGSEVGGYRVKWLLGIEVA